MTIISKCGKIFISMKNVFEFIRVSTVKQGAGVSLQELKEVIFRHAEKHQLNIIR